QALPTVESWEPEGIKHAIHEVLEANGIKMGKVMQILRVALSGNGAGPDLMISMQLWTCSVSTQGHAQNLHHFTHLNAVRL
ncbi:MAG: hypothetical protein ACKOUQ_03025, partial [Aquirufa sp.]